MYKLELESEGCNKGRGLYSDLEEVKTDIIVLTVFSTLKIKFKRQGYSYYNIFIDPTKLLINVRLFIINYY